MRRLFYESTEKILLKACLKSVEFNCFTGILLGRSCAMIVSCYQDQRYDSKIPLASVFTLKLVILGLF